MRAKEISDAALSAMPTEQLTRMTHDAIYAGRDRLACRIGAIVRQRMRPAPTLEHGMPWDYSKMLADPELNFGND